MLANCLLLRNAVFDDLTVRFCCGPARSWVAIAARQLPAPSLPRPRRALVQHGKYYAGWRSPCRT